MPDLFISDVPEVNGSKKTYVYSGDIEINVYEVFFHVVAIGYSPAYLAENADGIQQGWPRIPLPATEAVFENSAALGRRVASLLDTESPVEGVSAAPLALHLRPLGRLSVRNKQAAPDLAITAGWGHGGNGKPVMPSRGRTVQRPYTPEEVQNLTPEQQAQLGPDCLDVWLNDTTYWAAIPVPVWEFYIGGYQVIKKWLSYREQSVLGRPLLPEEARYVAEMVRRLTELVLLQPALDANYQAVKSNVYPWPAEDTAT